MHLSKTTMHQIQQQYQDLAYQHLGIDPADWQPHVGFRANEPTLQRLYRYYQQLYQQHPQHFLWAGLARLTGGQVLFGMQNAVKIAKDPCVLTQEIVAIAKDIFENLAWQHELFLVDQPLLISVCEILDQHQTHTYKYADCWKKIGSGTYENRCAGNRMLLENEQRNTIQPHYETIRKDAYANRYFRFTRFVMRNIHPHHRRFLLDNPWGDVTRFDDRWQWIGHPRGMWASWVGLAQAERDRLVALSNEDVVAHRW
ncbi:MAG: hypothetical protein LH618_19135 [Saprospiraceae bacterium]|nr:hypothetical protein [Saprospiraceae bacterium]